MARKKAAAPAATKTPPKRKARKRTSAPKAVKATRAAKAATSSASAFAAFKPQMPDFGDMGKMAKMVTPEQAIELYKTNAKMALDVINAAIDSTARLRKRQFEGEEEARAFQKKHARSVGEANDPQSLMAASQGAAKEAMEKSMHYWSEMFELIVEMQKRIFTLIDEQMAGVPGVKEAKAAMAMMPDLRQMQKVVSAMQGVVTSGGSAFETMQRVMGDFAKMAGTTMPGMRR
jgi:phasin family protein